MKGAENKPTTVTNQEQTLNTSTTVANQESVLNTSTTVANQDSALPLNDAEIFDMSTDTNNSMQDNKVDFDEIDFTFGSEQFGFDTSQDYQQIGRHIANFAPSGNVYFDDLSPVSPPVISNYFYSLSEGSYANQSPLPLAEIEESLLHASEGSYTTPSPLPSKNFKISQNHVSAVNTALVENIDAREAAEGKISHILKSKTKAKLYECEEPLSDPVEEKKRQNAINAKRNRTKQKNRLQELENLANNLTNENITLKENNIKMKKKCEAFEKQLKIICQ